MKENLMLNPAASKFVLHWGKMGNYWGASRISAEVYALLLISPNPLPADEIADMLAAARSSIGASLRDLQVWGAVRVAHVLGDRREHFVCTTDMLEAFRSLFEQRKKREIIPTVHVLRECIAELQSCEAPTDYMKDRAGRLVEYLTKFSDHLEVFFYPAPTHAESRDGNAKEQTLPKPAKPKANGALRKSH